MLELKGRTAVPVPGYDNKIEFGILTSFAYKIDGTGTVYAQLADSIR